MVVDEKALMKAMRAAYKSEGYEVAVDDRGGQTDVIISTALWTVVIKKSTLLRKVLGLIAEHVGEIPEAGEAYQVKKKETQTKIFNHTVDVLTFFRSSEKPIRIIRRTRILWAGFPVWQATDRKVIRLLPVHERIMKWDGETVRLFGDEHVMVADDDSRVYIHVLPVDEKEQYFYEHLAQVDLLPA